MLDILEIKARGSLRELGRHPQPAHDPSPRVTMPAAGLRRQRPFAQWWHRLFAVR